MIQKIPDFLNEKLLKQYGEEWTEKIIEGYSKNRHVTLRVNTLKNNMQNIKNTLQENSSCKTNLLTIIYIQKKEQ